MNHEPSRQDHVHANGANYQGHAGEAPHDDEDGRWTSPELYTRQVLTRVRRELQQHPFRTLSLAVGLGVGVGTLLASRIARMLVVTAGSYAAKEFLQGRVKAFLAEA